jgi:hypothetical protein
MAGKNCAPDMKKGGKPPPFVKGDKPAPKAKKGKGK